jgi:hypothetical protein
MLEGWEYLQYPHREAVKAGRLGLQGSEARASRNILACAINAISAPHCAYITLY